MDSFEQVRHALDYMRDECEFVHSPRLVSNADFAKERGRFKEQSSEIPGFSTELVDQGGPGISGDDHEGDMAFRLSNGWWLVVGYSC